MTTRDEIERLLSHACICGRGVCRLCDELRDAIDRVVQDGERMRSAYVMAHEQAMENGAAAAFAKASIAERDARIADHEEVHADVRRICREIDVALYGADAAEQPSLCDIQASVTREVPALRARIAVLEKALLTSQESLAMIRNDTQHCEARTLGSRVYHYATKGWEVLNAALAAQENP